MLSPFHNFRARGPRERGHVTCPSGWRCVTVLGNRDFADPVTDPQIMER
jgi:hypothetical protein